MKLRGTFFFLILMSLFFTISLNAQSFDGEWTVDYVTDDDGLNGTGYNTPDVGVINENTFVALVRRGTNSTSYLVGYSNADSSNGRLGEYGYGSGVAGYQQEWTSGFDLVSMIEAVAIEATSDSLIYVANNDDDRNILVFKLTADSVESTEYRMITGADSIWAIDVDASGKVYVSTVGDSVTPGSILVFESIANDLLNWSTTHVSTPLATITLPDAGEIRGLAVNDAGNIVYASNYTNEKVYCYIGDPVNGYTLVNGFDFTLTDEPVAQDSSSLNPGPWGLGFMNEKNILFVAADVSFTGGTGYDYGRIYALNPNTGEILDTIDAAGWNLEQSGSTNNHAGGTVSGYTSTYNVDFDENFNLYTQSYFGWTVDKWVYSGEIPTIPITITSIEREEGVIPNEFNLSQNYPNPFNPSTTIEFSVTEQTDVNLSVFSITGELIANLINSQSFDAGTYKYTFDASKLASGTYIYVLKSGDAKISKKMTLLK